MAYPIDEDKFVDICMRGLGEYSDADVKIAYVIAATLNWAYYKDQDEGKQNE